MNSPIDSLLLQVWGLIVQPILVLVFVLAALFFFWGVAELIRNSSSEDGRQKGKRHMIWGIIGMFVMVSVFGIVSLIANTLGVQDTLPPFPPITPEDGG
jgi:uncharacterized membrane protein YidH (DUF202 family)